ncbi:MAG: GMC family oxidoreductase [Flavobacteriales bacterium]|nr:GMC family oxidoreductase [Flavobacteriales bacterium]
MSDENNFDVVIVGAGIAGVITANELAKAGHKVLILEAGVKKDMSFETYQQYTKNYYENLIKIPNSPFPNNPNAPQPLVTDCENIEPDVPPITNSGYFIQKGPEPFQSTYTRSKGGTLLHWLGTCLRMLPADFQEKTLYGNGLDWPISYKDLMPYYEKAELEIGVSADVDEQKFLGITFKEGYVYPMYKIPQSYSDKKLAKWIDGMEFVYKGEKHPIAVVSTPQGRNSTPNPNYKNGEGYMPVGAVGRPEIGQRCEGNSSCVPICPVQAKYNALKTLDKALKNGVTLWSQCVVSEVVYDDSGTITGIKYKQYVTDKEPEYVEKIITAKKYVLATHAVENAKILLASGIHSTSDQVGRNLMDHPVFLAWGLVPEPIGSFRGPGSTSGIPSLRGGKFRKDRSAFRVEIGNWGWNWPTAAPFSQLTEAIEDLGLFGNDLRKHMFDYVQHMMRFGFLIEQQPEPYNRVTIDKNYLDELGNYRPVISYKISDHVKEGMLAAKEFTTQMFEKARIQNESNYTPDDVGYTVYKGEKLWWQGAGHLAGTHIMGTNKKNSVVNKYQKCWDHQNLYLVGCGSMPTLATSNPTLTMTAMTFMAVEGLIKDLALEQNTSTSTEKIKDNVANN